MGTRGTGRKGGIEVQVEAMIDPQMVFEDFDHVDVMVSFKMDLAEA